MGCFFHVLRHVLLKYLHHFSYICHVAGTAYRKKYYTDKLII